MCSVQCSVYIGFRLLFEGSVWNVLCQCLSPMLDKPCLHPCDLWWAGAHGSPMWSAMSHSYCDYQGCSIYKHGPSGYTVLAVIIVCREEVVSEIIVDPVLKIQLKLWRVELYVVNIWCGSNTVHSTYDLGFKQFLLSAKLFAVPNKFTITSIGKCDGYNAMAYNECSS